MHTCANPQAYSQNAYSREHVDTLEGAASKGIRKNFRRSKFGASDSYPWLRGRWRPDPSGKARECSSTSVMYCLAARTASTGVRPLASSAAIQAAVVHPVPWLLLVRTLGPWIRVASFPSYSTSIASSGAGPLASPATCSASQSK